VFKPLLDTYDTRARVGAANVAAFVASGLSLFAGMAQPEDLDAGCICHALDLDMTAGTLAQYGFVYPGSDTDWLAFKGSSSYQLPYGAHLRMKASTSIAGCGPQGAMVVRALKSYGGYVSDTGRQDSLYFGNRSDGSNPWSSSDLSCLKNVNVGQFDVLTLPAIQRVPGH
jgi:hypothetical protein